MLLFFLRLVLFVIFQIAYTMSPSQLNELWHYDMWLGHILMDLPLRRCTAIPTEALIEFPAMDQCEFQQLKDQVRKMWIFASYYFTCNKTKHGWGLIFADAFDGNEK